MKVLEHISGWSENYIFFQETLHLLMFFHQAGKKLLEIAGDGSMF